MATAWLINSLAFYLSPIALTVVLGYSYTKRFTALCHLVLGLGLSLAPIGAYISVTGSFNSIIPIIFSFVVLFWTAGFDIIYALQDADFDKENNLKSIPSILGKKRALLVARSLHILTALLVMLAGYFLNTGVLYSVAVGVFFVALFSQHRLVKADDLSKVNLAFFTANGFASIVFSGLTILSLYY